MRKTGEVFLSASMIKVPVLLAWVMLERDGLLSRHALCDLDTEPQVQGSGFSWLLEARRLPYHDLLLMMIATSDNLCTNLVVNQIGIERLHAVMHDRLGLSADTRLERKLMDYEARAAGKDNFIAARDCIRLFELVKCLRDEEKAWVEPMLGANVDAALLMRDIPRDTVEFKHKTGSITGLLHDWGYTDNMEIFLLTQDVKDEVAAAHAFGALGKLLIE